MANLEAALPEGWQLQTVENLSLRIFGGGTPSTSNSAYWNGTIPWTTSALIEEDSVHLDRFQKTITTDGLENSSSQIAPRGSVLVGTRVGVGKTAVTTLDMAINQDLTAIVPNGRTLPEFLALCLKQPFIKAWFAGSQRGTTIKGIARKDLARLEIPLPPIAEQQSITDVLLNVRQAKEATERLFQKPSLPKTGAWKGSHTPPT